MVSPHPPPLATTDPLQFRLSQCHVAGIVQYVGSRTGFFRLVICVSDPSVPYQNSMAHPLLVPNNIPLAGQTAVHLPNPSAEGRLGCSQALVICVQVFLQIHVLILLGKCQGARWLEQRG